MADFPKVVVVVCHETDHVVDAGVALAKAGFSFGPLQDRASGLVWGLMAWFEDGVPVGCAKQVAEVLADHGFDTVAYEPFHDHELGHTHAFQRVYTPTRSADAFLAAYQLVEDSDLWDFWVFGTSEVVDDALGIAEFLGMTVRRVEGPDGLMCGEVRVRDSVRFDLAREWWLLFEWTRVPASGKPLPAGSTYEDPI